jgi:PhnB protein
MAAVTAYLFFNGRCEEALEFYKRTLGAQVEAMMRNAESPEPPPPGMKAPPEKILHSSLRIGDTVLLASDGMSEGQTDFRGFSLSITAKDQEDAKRIFNALADGGQVQLPLGPTFWSPCFGMVSDKFGLGWMVGIEH